MIFILANEVSIVFLESKNASDSSNIRKGDFETIASAYCKAKEAIDF
jgi:hypothetical protein